MRYDIIDHHVETYLAGGYLLHNLSIRIFTLFNIKFGITNAQWKS